MRRERQDALSRHVEGSRRAITSPRSGCVKGRQATTIPLSDSRGATAMEEKSKRGGGASAVGSCRSPAGRGGRRLSARRLLLLTVTVVPRAPDDRAADCLLVARAISVSRAIIPSPFCPISQNQYPLYASLARITLGSKSQQAQDCSLSIATASTRFRTPDLFPRSGTIAG